jgi:hypothetical protein
MKPPGRGYLMECRSSGYPVLEAPWCSCREPERVPSRVTRLGCNWRPSYPGYKTLTVAPEPFIMRVVGAVRSTGSRIGTHMLLRVPSQDRVMTMVRRGMTEVVTCDRSPGSTTRVEMYIYYKRVQ